jgi:hypothetical protein
VSEGGTEAKKRIQEKKNLSKKSRDPEEFTSTVASKKSLQKIQQPRFDTDEGRPLER